MKKTMFITSVIMVVVMAIALTTSSLAWFSASGADSVTTSAMSVTAYSTTTTGISISHDADTWGSEIALIGDDVHLMPMVPFSKDVALNTSLDGEELANDKDRVNAAIIKALAGGVDDPEDNNSPTYDAFMIGGKIDSNKNYTNAIYRHSDQAKQAGYYNGYFVDTFYLKNDASGAEAANIKFSASISFKCKYYSYNTTSSQWESELVTYSDTARNTLKSKNNTPTYDYYAQDAVLCVAVLAKVNEFYTDSDLYTEYSTSTPLAAKGGWELVAYAESKGDTNINVGKQATDFAQGHSAASSFYAYDRANIVKTNNTDELRPARTYADTELHADYKTVKVIAWYDGASLNGSNAADMDLYFDLQFTKVPLQAQNP